MKKIIRYPNLVAQMAVNGDKQKDIAKLLDIPLTSVNRRLNGKIEWRKSEIEILCKYYNMDFYKLFEEKEVQN